MQLGEVGSRILIVDYNHMIHQYMNSKAPRLFTNIPLGAQVQQVETTIPAYTLKAINKWAGCGEFTLAVCFDSPCSFRKEYFRKNSKGMESQIEYKGDRKPMLKSMYEGSEMTQKILFDSNIPVYKANDFEADDLVYSLVMICKELYPNTPIDIVCNDADLIPLVDNQVSVFYRSKKLTWATNKKIEKRNYWQVTPYNYEQIVGELSKYVKFEMPYNTLLLHKLLRGDDSDGIPGCINPETGRQDFPPKMYNELIGMMMYDRVDFNNIFRYPTFFPRKAKQESLDMQSKGIQCTMRDIYNKVVDDKVKEITSVLANYVDDYTLEHVDYTYRGMSTRFLNLVVPKRYDANTLRVEASRLQIDIPV